MKYYHAHSIISLVAMLACSPFVGLWGGCLVGITIYASREITQYKYEGFFDYKGLIWPLITNLLIALILHTIIN